MQDATKRMVTKAVDFICEKRSALGSRGMVVTNHPLASAAGAEMLLAGGNAIDAAVAALFALTVVEPMMVGILGGGVAHISTPDGAHTILDGLSTAPAAASSTMYDVLQDQNQNSRLTRGRANEVGPLAVATPGALAGWCEALERFGTMTLDDVLQPAIRLAARGFVATHYLADCIKDMSADLASDHELSRLFLPNGLPLAAGDRLVQADYADTLRLIGRKGPGVIYGGPLGAQIISHIGRQGGILSGNDLRQYRVKERAPVRGLYRGYEIFGPPPPASAGVHITQMLNILEGFDLAGMGFGSADSIHVLAEVIKIAFADRAIATADPDFVNVPVEKLIDKSYATLLREQIRLDVAQGWTSSLLATESRNTTHVTVVDNSGNAIATTQTINSLFGACMQIPGTGLRTNNYMYNFDPRPGKALSIEPGKRVFTSMAPMMVRKDGKLRYALGLPGALRIFPSAMQAIINLIDHRMTLQQAVEAPRIWTDGGALEVEPAVSDHVIHQLRELGHDVVRVGRIAGGMGAVAMDDDGGLTGAACWRADGTPVAIAGGLARPGIRFST